MSDIGFGDDSCHDDTQHAVTGIIIQGAGTVMAGGLPVARMSDIIMRPDGHSGILIGGSGTVMANGLPVARMSENFVGCFTGILITGAPNVITGG